MRIISINTNGIRAAARKGFFSWLAAQNADVVCIQETKAQRQQLDDPQFHPKGYHCHYHDAEKKGYSGVAIYSKALPDKVTVGLGWPEIDREGRYLAIQLGKLTVASLYMHSGTAGEHRQNLKYAFMAKFLPFLRQQAQPLIVCGDWNIAHQKIDLKNWQSNQKNSGFLPEERAWMDALLDNGQFVDAFRCVNLQAEQYTWWSNRGQAWLNNTGWRIDYQIISADLAKQVKTAHIYKEQRFSDHAPLMIDYDF